MPARRCARSTARDRQLRRAPRPVDRRAAPRRHGGRARDQAHKLEAGPLRVLRSARRAARQDAGRVRGGARDARRRHHDDHAAGQGHLASHRVSGVQRGRRHRPAGDGGRRQFRHGAPIPTTFRVLPWAEQHRLGAVRHLFPERQAGAVLDPRALPRRARRLAQAGFDFCAGLEVEFHLFKLDDPKLAPDGLTWPAEPPAVEHTTHGYQFLDRGALRSGRADPRDPAQDRAGARPAAASLEVEFGPSQFEFTFAPRARPRRRPTRWCCSAAR